MGVADPNTFDVRIGSRDTERLRVLASVDALCRNFTTLVLVLDLSVTGARIEAQFARFQIDDVVRLRLPFLPVEQPGEIIWTNGLSAGLRFFRPLEVSTFRILSKVMQPNSLVGAPHNASGVAKPDSTTKRACNADR